MKVCELRGMFSALSILMGCALLLGGSRRISASAYEVVVATGGTYVWGPLFIVSGLVTAVVSRISLRWALLLGGAGYAVLCAAFVIAATKSPVANFTGPVAYAWIAVMHALASEQVRKDVAWTAPSLSQSVGG